MKTEIYNVSDILQNIGSRIIAWIAYMIFCKSSLSYPMEKQSVISK